MADARKVGSTKQTTLWCLKVIFWDGTRQRVMDLIPFCVTRNGDDYENLAKQCTPFLEQLRLLQENGIDFDDKTNDGVRVHKVVESFLAGDMKFVLTITGHKGASCKNPCFRCYVDKSELGCFEEGTPRPPADSKAAERC